MWGKRETQTANDNDLISVSLKIIRAPSSGRGRRAKRGGVGFPECGSTVSRGQPPPLRGTSFQRKEGEKRGCVYRHRSICGEVGAFSAISATPEPAPTISFPEESGEVRGICGGSARPRPRRFRALVAALPRSMKRSQLFWHSLSYIRCFSPLRMTKRGDVRRMDDRSPDI